MRDDDILKEGLDGASEVTAEFTRHMDRLRGAVSGTGGEVEGLSRGLSKGLRKAFDGVAMDGERLSDALRGVGRTLLDTVYAAAMKPVTEGIGSAVSRGVASLLGGAQPFERGGAFVQGRVTPFAKGGVVGAPTTFPMRGGAGLMGEAGPEAIMPLARGADGRLGVRTEGPRAPSVTINVTTPDVEGFRRSRSQVAAEMSRALGRGARNR